MNERTQDRQTPGEGPALDEPAQASAAQDPDEEPALTRPLPRQRRWPWIAGILLGGAVLAAGAWLWLSQGSEEQTKAKGRGDPNARTMPVVAAAARKGSIEVYITALGTVVPRNMVVVRTRVDGQLMTVAFREGQTVKAGELLAQIDPRPFEVR